MESAQRGGQLRTQCAREVASSAPNGLCPSDRIVRIGCGAGYQGDRIAPAVTLVQNAQLDFLFLECLAERTLAIAHRRMQAPAFSSSSRSPLVLQAGGPGYDTRLEAWLTALVPAALKHNTKIVTNFGAADPFGAGSKAIKVLQRLGLPEIKVVCCGEDSLQVAGSSSSRSAYTYLGADLVVQALSQGADLVITGRCIPCFHTTAHCTKIKISHHCPPNRTQEFTPLSLLHTSIMTGTSSTLTDPLSSRVTAPRCHDTCN